MNTMNASNNMTTTPWRDWKQENRNGRTNIPSGNWRTPLLVSTITTVGGINPPVSRREGVPPSRPTHTY